MTRDPNGDAPANGYAALSGYYQSTEHATCPNQRQDFLAYVRTSTVCAAILGIVGFAFYALVSILAR